MTSRLELEAEAFVQRLEQLLRNTVDPHAELAHRLVDTPYGERAIIKATSPNGLINLPTHEHGAGSLNLRVQFTAQMDDEGEHLAITTSVFGLCIDERTNHCPIRVEYDRHKPGKQAAHIQVDADSPALREAYAAAGTAPKHMVKLHIPAGHRRFRPSLEDFIEFLHQENLIRNMQPNWRVHLEESRAGWEQRQLRAAVRRDTKTAAEELARHGYVVVPLGEFAQRIRRSLTQALRVPPAIARRIFRGR